MPRSSYVLTPEDQVRVRELAAIGMSEEDIAVQLCLPQPRLRKIFKLELKDGVAMGREQVLRKLHAVAISCENMSASTFWVKSRCGWRDTGTPQISPEVIRSCIIFKCESDSSKKEIPSQEPEN